MINKIPAEALIVRILSGGIGVKIPEVLNSAAGLKSADRSLE